MPLAPRAALLATALALGASTGCLTASTSPADAPPPRPPIVALEPLSITDGGPLTLTLATDPAEGTHTLSVADARSAATWVATAGEDEGWLVSAEKATDDTLLLGLVHPVKGGRFNATVTVQGDALAFDLKKADDAPFEWLNYPPKFQAPLEDGRLLFADRSAGTLLPQDDDGFYVGRVLLSMGNTGSLDLPMIGVVEGRDGHGHYVAFDTPEDVVVRLEEDEATGDLWPQVIWIRSLGDWGNDRRARVVFVPDGGYVAQALRYREDARAAGLLKSLREKAAARPRVEWLAGAPILWDTDGVRFAREARARGLSHALLATRFAPQDMIALRDMGFLTAEYDSYTDFTPSDDVVDPHHDKLDRARVNADGKPAKGWLTLHGQQYYSLSHAFALERARLFIPPLLEEFPFTSRFIDVSTAIELQEDWHPDRMLSRADDRRLREDLFRYMQDELGLVMGGEHANAWAVPVLDYTEGPLSGAFWWNTKVGHLQALQSRDDVDPDYVKYGLGSALRVPLHDLVFKDAIVSTWYWGDSNGFLYNVWPELSDWKDAVNVLHGAPPLMWGGHLCYGWDRNRERFLRTARLTTAWHAALFHEALVHHEADAANVHVQRSRFSNGAEATINMGTEAATATHRGEQLLLPHGGIAADTDGLRVRRVLVDGDVVIHVQGDDGFLFVEQSTERTTGPATGAGSLCFFKLEDGRWGADVRGAWTLDLDALATAPEGPIRLFRADTLGRLQSELVPPQGRVLALDGGKDGRIFVLLDGVALDQPVFAPEGGEIAEGESVSISAPGAREIRLTTDGSVPTSASGLYALPITLDRGATLTTCAMRDGQPIGEPVTATFAVTRVLMQDALVKGGDPVRPFTLDVDGARELRLVVTDANDGQDYDTFLMGDVRGITADGEEVLLETLPILRSYQTSRTNPALALREVTIGESEFDTGVFTHARGEITWELGGRFVRVEGHMGTDKPEGQGSVHATFTGVY